MSQETIQTVSIENAIFVASTSLGNFIPNPLQALTGLAESLGDIVVLTANQIRMLFRLAAIHGQDPGYKRQSAEITSIIGAAFGWRSIARELISHVPFGGGVIPKAAIAFAGTWAVGDGIVYYYTTGRRITRDQIRDRFQTALVKGKEQPAPWSRNSSAEVRLTVDSREYARQTCAKLAPSRRALVHPYSFNSLAIRSDSSPRVRGIH